MDLCGQHKRIFPIRLSEYIYLGVYSSTLDNRWNKFTSSWIHKKTAIELIYLDFFYSRYIWKLLLHGNWELRDRSQPWIKWTPRSISYTHIKLYPLSFCVDIFWIKSKTYSCTKCLSRIFWISSLLSYFVSFISKGNKYSI